MTWEEFKRKRLIKNVLDLQKSLDELLDTQEEFFRSRKKALDDYADKVGT